MSPVQQTFFCPACHKPHILYNGENVLVYVCGKTNAVLRKRTAGFEETHRLRAPKTTQQIPLGTSGTLRGKAYTVITFAERVEVGTSYYWTEYTLRREEDKQQVFLSVYDGHWMLATPLENNGLVDAGELPHQYSVMRNGIRFPRAHRYRAKYSHVSGEFDWDADMRYGMHCIEYNHPPEMVIVEYEDPKEPDLFLGTYIKPREVSKAFMNGAPLPRRIGVGVIQPFPMRIAPRRFLNGALVFCIVALLVQWCYNRNRRQLVLFSDTVIIDTATMNKPRVTPAFNLEGSTSNIEVEINSDIANNWCAADVSMVNEQTGEESDFSVEADYYRGIEDGESWSEGSPRQTEFVCHVKPGRYHFVVTPVTDAIGPPVQLTLSVIWDVPTYWNGALVAVIMLALAGTIYLGREWFEMKRG
jgi:hypothetical protein